MEKVVASFWSGKKVFLTGHTGFKGTWLSLWLKKMGAQVTGYALAPQEPSLFTFTKIENEIHSIFGDVRDLEKLKNSMVAANPEIIIHMAAQPLVRASYEIPVETYATNVMGTVHVFEAARSLQNLRAVVNVTTDKVYENKERTQGYEETDALGGYDPYSNSKACSELVTASYLQSFFNPKEYTKHKVGIATARAGNVIGGGDWATDRIIPDLFRSFSKKEVAIIRNPQAVRPWQHVLDPLSGYLVLAQKLCADGARFSQAFNFGPRNDDSMAVEEMVSEISKLWGEGASYQVKDHSGPHETQLLKLDCSKANSVLDWQPKLSIQSALVKTVAWQKEFSKNTVQAKELCLRQIEEYEGL